MIASAFLPALLCSQSPSLPPGVPWIPMSERTLFSGAYMEGSSHNKAIGIFNPTNEPVEIGSEVTGYMLVGTDGSETEGDV